MNNQLSHIFDESVCLTKRQIKDYVSGHMSREECHAVELHLNSCPLCSMAVEGLSERPAETVAALAGINTSFLQEHISKSMPQVHLNSIAPAATLQPSKNKKNVQPLWRNASIAAVVVVCCGLAWLWESGKNKKNEMLAQKSGTSSAIAANEQQTETTASETPANKEPKNHKNGSSQKPPLLIATTRTHNTSDAENEKASKKTTADEAETEAEVLAAENAKNTKSEKAEPTVAKGMMSAAEERNAADSQPPKTEPVVAKMTAMSAAPRERVSVDALEVADAAYDKKYYNAALDQYKEAMKNPDANRRYKATIGAARCYIALGQKKAAKELLEKILSDKHADKEPAQSLLKETE